MELMFGIWLLWQIPSFPPPREPFVLELHIKPRKHKIIYKETYND